jgi:hypothetical protein
MLSYLGERGWPHMPLDRATLERLVEQARERDGVLRVGFTGTRKLDAYGREAIATTVLFFVQLCEDNGLGLELTHGACYGADAFAGQTALIYSGISGVGQGYGVSVNVHAVVPTDMSRVPEGWRQDCHTWEQMPEGSSYRDRNKRIVRRADVLFAVANYPEDHGSQKYSGTWMTVRLGREANIPTFWTIQHED